MTDIRIERDVRIPTDDEDVTLSADLVRPDDGRPHPALITVLPYRNDAGGGLMMASELDWYARHGFACVLVDPRGIGDSDGTQRHPFDADESDDGVAAVNWAADQPWCTGSVGMWGHSYGALMALRTAERAPAALRAIAPVQGMLDPERDFVRPNGIRSGLGAIPTWGLGMLVNQLLPPTRQTSSEAAQRRWRQRLDVEPWLIDMFRPAPGDSHWRSRAVDASRIRVPALCVAGWRDLFCDASIRAYEQINAPKKLIVGPWMHTVPHFAPAAAIDFRAIALRWWNHWLIGEDTGVLDEPDVLIYEQGESAGWRAYPHWPLPTDDTAIDLPAPTPQPMAPDPAVGADSGLSGLPSGFGAPLDQHNDDMRAVTVTGQPLTGDVTLIGRPRVTVELADTTAKWVAVRLCIVDDEGRSTLITSGNATVDDPVTEITLNPTAYRLPAGIRIRIAVSVADFPRLWPQVPGSPYAASSIRLELPVMNQPTQPEAVVPDAPMEVPLLAELLISGDGEWTISRDLAHDSVAVTTAEANAVHTMTRDSTLAQEFKRALSVSRANPAGASAQASGRAEFKPDNGPHVRVSTQLIVTADNLEVAASVEQDCHQIWHRTWRIERRS